MFWGKPLQPELRDVNPSGLELPGSAIGVCNDEVESRVIKILHIPCFLWKVQGQLMIRKEYEALYERLSLHCELCPTTGTKLTGHPEIGKDMNIVPELSQFSSV
jgi:hypothetical protein